MDRRRFLSATALTTAAYVSGGLSPAGATARQAAPLAPQSARMADSLCDAYMINTRIFHATKIYRHTDAVIDLVRDLGARNVRERIITGSSTAATNQRRAMLELAQDGVRWHATVGVLENWRNAVAVNSDAINHIDNYFVPRVGNLSNVFRSLSGCNEVDGPQSNGQVDPNWAPHARIMQEALWSAAKAKTSTRSLPIAGPSTRTDYTPARAAALGDLSRISDQGSVHYYNKGMSPTRGIDDRIAISKRNFPNTNIWVVAETGYNDSRQDNLGKTIPEWAAAVYAIRGICDFFKRGAVYGRFELLDDPDAVDTTSQRTINATSDREAHFGVVGMTRTQLSTATPDTWRKKPEFLATQRLMRIISDRGPAFNPSPLQIAINGAGNDLQSLVLQKRNGKHYLLLWRDVNIVEPYASGKEIVVAPTRVSLTLSPARPIAIYRPNRSGSPESTVSPTTSLTVNVAGELVILEIG